MYYAASTNSAGSTTRENESPGGSEGVCKGIRSKLQMIESDQNRMTRVQALERFSTVITDFDGGPYDDEDGELHQHAESTFVSPVLVFQNRANDSGTEKKPLQKEELLPEEQTTPTSETWSCYGATEVEYLVLQDLKTGTKTITAVAPKNTGFSVRGIRSPDAQRTISRLGLGFVHVIHDMQTSVSDDATEGATGSMPTPEEVPPRPLADSIEIAKESLHNAIDFSGKVAQHMEMNLAWLGNNLMDDFPSRTLHKGRQILHHLPGTCHNTMICMRQLVGHLFDDENEDDDR